jgi:hypothetical protein
MTTTGKRVLLFTMLGALGLAALIVVAGCGIGIWFLFSSTTPILGQWVVTHPPFGGRMTFEFRADGTGAIQSPSADIDFVYTLSRDQPPILERRVTHFASGGKFAFKSPTKRAVAPGAQLEIKANDVILVGAVTERYRITLDNDSLTLTNENAAALPFLLRPAQ